MADLPSGIVTFLFTDIEGSTLLWERDPEAMQLALERHNAILQAAIKRQDGITFKLVGDGFHAAFAKPAQALRAAIEIQGELFAVKWGAIGTLRVRMGLHTGPAEIREGEYVSHTLNRVSRVMYAAHGGQILATSAVADQVGSRLPRGSSLRDMGQHYLKGMLHPEHLYQVMVPGLPTEFPPLNEFEQSPNNLPLVLTSFVGRGVEINAVSHLLKESRLVTLTGSGGVGKTRLAIEVGRRDMPAYTDGIWLVELASLTDPMLVPSAVADVLGIQESQDRTLMESLKDYLLSKRSLLIIDNCEHLIEASARMVATLLHACPRLTVLASSREALSLPGEQAFFVPSLTLPGEEKVLVQNASQYEALQLFTDRALSSHPGFMLTDENIDSVVQICKRLDGIPLAIELAAARTRTLNIGQIAQRLDDRFRLLTGGSRTALPRQQTLRATIDWSYGLLSQTERRLLERLSIFSGSSNLKAAETICPGEDIREFEILDLLTSLVNKSMLNVEREQGKEPRFHLLETIRQYAREKLFESGKMSEYRDRHVAYFLDWAETADPKMRGPEQALWLERMDREYENMAAALEWASESDPAAGLRLASASWWYMWMRNKGQECVRWLSYFLQRPHNEARNSARGNALGRLGFYLMMHPAHLSDSEELVLESLEISREVGDETSEAFALFMLGYIHYYRKFDYGTARAYFEQSMSLYQRSGNLWGLGRNFYNLGNMDGHLGDTLSQYEYLEKSLAVCRKAGDLRGIAVALDNLAAVRAEVDCDLQGGRKMVEEAIEIYHSLKASGAISNAMIVFGRILAWQGEYPQARAIFKELAEILRQRGGAIWNVESSSYFGFLDRLEGEDGRAISMLEDCLAHLNSIDPDHKQYQIELIELIIELGLVLARSGSVLRARDLFEQALSLASTPAYRARLLQGMGVVAAAQADGKLAAKYLRECMHILQDSNYRFYVISTLEDYANALRLLSDHYQAAQILGTTAATRQRIGAPKPPGDKPRYETFLADLKDRLGEARFDQAWNEGQAMSLDEAVTSALEELN